MQASGDRSRPDIPHHAMPIIVGAPRSGTTLLRLMLDAHSELAIPPETGFLGLGAQFAGTSNADRQRFFEALTQFPPDAPAWNDFGVPKALFREALLAIEPFSMADGYRAFYRLYAARFGKTRWGDKTPVHTLSMQAIEQVLPEASFVHIIRDGRDVGLSLRGLWFSPGHDMETQARHWRDFVSTGRQQGAGCRRYLEVRYESLVADPRPTLQTICAFLGLTYEDALLRYHERAPERLREHATRLRADGRVVVTHEQRLLQQQRTTRPPEPGRIGVWRTAMSAEERQRFEAVAGDLLAALGYQTLERPSAPSRTASPPAPR